MNPEGKLQLIRVGGRLVVAVWLLLALAPPSLPWGRAALDITVLLDESLSMPRDISKLAWRQVLELVEAAPESSSLRLVRFAATPVLEPTLPLIAGPLADQQLPRSVALDGSATNIESALRLALHGLAAGRPAALLLVSDGAASHGDTDSALLAASAAGVPVVLLAPQTGSQSPPLRLLDVQAPSQVVIGTRVPVVARVLSNSAGTVEVLLEVDGLQAERQRLALAAGEPASLSFHMLAEQPGFRQLTVRLAGDPTQDTTAPWLTQTRVVNVLGLAPLLHVARGSVPGPLVRSLELSGWGIESVPAAQFMAHQSSLQRAGAIVLEDVAIADMAEAAWATLLRAVQDDGKGLLVLGGGHSFGAGAYRLSRLEEILPVTAEAARPEPPAAVVFVLDRSGSMGRGQAGPSRFALARQAVLASMEKLLPGDHAGIIAFAADAETRLALGPGWEDTDAVRNALDLSPAGGTHLAPALEAALQQLRTVGMNRRLLVLVTDGFAGDEDLQPLLDELRVAGVTVIALAVGDQANQATLQRLTGFNGGRLLPVNNSATLPRLMPGEIATERAPGQGPSTVPAQLRPLPFAGGSYAQWPPLSAYMVSRARPGAQLYLQSGAGDPLLATGYAGAARVAVLPGGLGSWARQWWEWPGFGRFLGGLLLWLNQDDSHTGLSLVIEDHPGQLIFTADLGGAEIPLAPDRARLSVRAPSGGVVELFPRLQAPGSYLAELPVTETGLYQATLQVGQLSVRRAIYRNASSEFPDAGALQLQLQAWRDRGAVREWAGAGAFLEDWPRNPAGTRQALLLLALLTYVLVLVYERGVARTLQARLRSWFAR